LLAGKRMMTSFQAVHSAEQIAELVSLAHEIWQEHYVPIIGQRQVDYMLEKFQSEKAVIEQLGNFYEYYIVIHQGQSVGYVAVVPNRLQSTLLISKIYIRGPKRGLRLGKTTLRFVENLCLQRGIKLIWLTVNKNNAHSIAWYLRMGFRNVGSTIAEIGGGFIMDDFRMEKTIDPQSSGATV